MPAKTRERHVLVTGGLGFIGSHCCITLLDDGYSITVFDDLSNSSEDVWERMQYIAGQHRPRLHFVQGDLKRIADLERAFSAAVYDAVIHCAGRKYVGESVASPFMYYTNNVLGTLNLVAMMRKVECKNMVFSSSCTVYGAPQYVPLDEQHPLQVVSPYGRTKLIVEDMFRDFSRTDKSWRVILLRYFNPVGAHASGLIGEEQKGFPNNLMPYVQEVVKGNRPHLNIFGNDYNTIDGTPVRDYIHVMDLASAHAAAVEKLWATPDIGCVAYNVGTGVGTSVLQMIDAFERASGTKIPLSFVARREGDTEAVWAATSLSERELKWKATRNLDDMCRDLWLWMQLNPDGYDTSLAYALTRCAGPLPHNTPTKALSLHQNAQRTPCPLAADDDATDLQASSQTELQQAPVTTEAAVNGVKGASHAVLGSREVAQYGSEQLYHASSCKHAWPSAGNLRQQAVLMA